ncbi:hypothetical protein [Propionimicrobium sp. PCR01-08-3]|uniref:hypothetical protein n=1 Tax=Propionimicrobium sp. PCR01-08-3 TaxID=3052086 RepID=UPI00255C4FA9|nr:hypothetical protein [Propionimicrobium sp. PCR01-08-3]WIY81716.1 hypothetical protein QQ658_09280 [Propionimicrobium sp. PCR01-08-3]
MAIVGAVALAGGVSLVGITPAYADESGPITGAPTSGKAAERNPDSGIGPKAREARIALADGTGPIISASLSGCSVEDGFSTIEARVYDTDLDMYYDGGGIVDAPASGAITLTAVASLPNHYYIDAICYGTDEESESDDASVYMDGTFQVERALLKLAGGEADGTWQAGEATAISSVSVAVDPEVVPQPDPSFSHAFTPNASVTISVTTPEGTATEVGTFKADENGDLNVSTALPFTVAGTYQITATGLRGEQRVVLYNEYSQAAPESPAPTPEPSESASAAPAPDKPSALPKTGSEGVDVGSIALGAGLVAVVGTAVLRSHKH